MKKELKTQLNREELEAKVDMLEDEVEFLEIRKGQCERMLVSTMDTLEDLTGYYSKAVSDKNLYRSMMIATGFIALTFLIILVLIYV